MSEGLPGTPHIGRVPPLTVGEGDTEGPGSGVVVSNDGVVAHV